MSTSRETNNPPLPEEDLGRGGDAASGFPAGTPGEREELSRDLAEPPGIRGPHKPDSPPPSATS